MVKAKMVPEAGIKGPLVIIIDVNVSSETGTASTVPVPEAAGER